MASKKGSAYGQPASDTSFRKNYDLDAAASRFKERETVERAEAKARYEAKMAGKRYYKPTTGNQTFTEARSRAVDFNAMVGRTQLVPAGGAVGMRGQGAGIYCDACDLRFRDNLSWLDHLNSRQHLQAIGQTDEVRRASAKEVHDMITMLWEEKERLKHDEVITLQERLDVQEKKDDEERESKRQKRREVAERKKEGREKEKMKTLEYGEDVRNAGEHDVDDMMGMVGFASFGSSKKK